MSKSRLEAFTDGVIAIVLTLLVNSAYLAVLVGDQTRFFSLCPVICFRGRHLGESSSYFSTG